MAPDPVPSYAPNYALILQRLDTIQINISEGRADVRKILDDHEARLRDLEDSMTRLEGRVMSFQIVQGVYTTVASVVAALFGHQK